VWREEVAGMQTARVLDWLGQAFRRSVGPDRGWLDVDFDLEPTHPPIERLASDLRRLGEESMRLHADRRVSARAFHLHVAELAYDDTLLMACGALGVETGAVRSPLSGVRRLELEVELARRGLRW
jgi:hypothetical protein